MSLCPLPTLLLLLPPVLGAPNLVKVPLLLVQGGSRCVRPLQVRHEVFDLILQPVLGLLQGGALGVDCLHRLLGLLQPLGQLLPTGQRGETYA